MKKIYKSSAVVISLFLVFSLLPVAGHNAVLADYEGEDSELLESVVGKHGEEYAVGELIVKYKGDHKPLRVAKIPTGKSVREAKWEFESRDDVEYAEPNYIAHAFMVPNDPFYSYQWNFSKIGMESAWNVSNGSGVTVAIVDTGVAYENYSQSRKTKYYLAPDLTNTAFVSGYDFVNDDTHPNDDNGHGTHVAGTVAGSTNNELGVAGIAYGASIMPVKVLDRNGYGTYADVADGIRFAVDHGAKVINLSLGGPSPPAYLEEAVAYAHDNRVTVIAATGNDGSVNTSYPAAYDNHVIAVGATRYDDTLAYYSNYGPSIDLVAPGGDLNVDQNNDGYGDGVLQQTFQGRTDSFTYWFFQGTSMAAPHVAGVAALVVANGNAATPDEVRAALQESATDLGATGRDNTYGYGLVDATAALGWAAGPIDNPPIVSITSPSNGAVVSGLVSITAEATDDSGVAQVDFYIDGALLGSDISSPYEWSWDSTSVSDSSYSIGATAVDTASQTASNNTSITVNNVNDPPVANAGPDQTVSDVDGTGMETVTLDGSASYDPDGAIVSYQWTEEAMVVGTTAIINSDFSVGSHTLILTVSDNEGTIASDEVIITVSANQPPIANAGPDQSAYVDDIVSFSGSGSNDPDGSIVSYQWAFGDGATASGITVSHAYAALGIYTVTLTVTDNGGAVGTDAAQVIISEPQDSPTAYGDIVLSVSGYRSWRATALVTLRETNASGSMIQNAMVEGYWSGTYAKKVSGTTNNEGQIKFETYRIKSSGAINFTITGVIKEDGTEYILAGETTDSIIGGSNNDFRKRSSRD